MVAAKGIKITFDGGGGHGWFQGAVFEWRLWLGFPDCAQGEVQFQEREMGDPRQPSSWGGVGGPWPCWGLWQTWAADPWGDEVPVLQAFQPLFHTSLGWQGWGISPQKAGLALCSSVPRRAKFTRFLPSVKSAVLWIQVEVWEFLATQGGILLWSLLEVAQAALFPKGNQPTHLRRGRQAGSRPGQCWAHWVALPSQWHLQGVRGKQPVIRCSYTTEVPRPTIGSVSGLEPPFLSYLDGVNQQQSFNDWPCCWVSAVSLHPFLDFCWCCLKHLRGEKLGPGLISSSPTMKIPSRSPVSLLASTIML